MGKTEDDAIAASIARDFVMARLAACRENLRQALHGVDQCIAMFIDVDADKAGKKRAKLLELVDQLAGDAAISVQLAQDEWETVDPKEGEPEPDDEEDDEDDDEEDDEDEDDEEDDDGGE